MVDAADARERAALAAPLRLMAVHAHPDDESSKGAATLAKYSAEGVGVVVVSCTGGERGDVLNPKLTIDGVDIPALRIREMARAAEILGVAHVWLGFHDSGYHEGRTGDLGPAGRSVRRARSGGGDRGPGQAWSGGTARR